MLCIDTFIKVASGNVYYIKSGKETSILYRFSDPTGMISEDENGLMQVSTDLWGDGRNNDFMNQSASDAGQRANINQMRQAGYITSGSGSGVGNGVNSWLSDGGQLGRDLTTYKTEFNRHAGGEVSREQTGNGVNITYEGKLITKEYSPHPGMIAAFGAAATLQGSAMGIVSEYMYSQRWGTYLGNGKGGNRFYHIAHQPNGWTGSRAVAETAANTAKVLGYGFAAVSLGTTLYGYNNARKSAGGNPGFETNLRFGLDIGVNVWGAFNVYGAAANVGWETGRLITNTNGYQNFKHYHALKTHGGRDGLLSTAY